MSTLTLSSSIINASPLYFPYFESKVQAGFPSPADDYLRNKLDLNEHLIKCPSSTFFVKVTGDSMTGAGIKDGDLLIIDKSIEATNGSIVIAVVCGEFTVKRLVLNNKGTSYLMPENDDYSPIKLCADSYIWGVVTKVVHSLR